MIPRFIAGVDLVYKFALLEGTLTNPKKFQIIPDIKIPFTCLRLEVKGCLEACTCHTLPHGNCHGDLHLLQVF